MTYGSMCFCMMVRGFCPKLLAASIHSSSETWSEGPRSARQKNGQYVSEKMSINITAPL